MPSIVSSKAIARLMRVPVDRPRLLLCVIHRRITFRISVGAYA